MPARGTKGRDTRHRIIDASINLFANEGFADASFSKIAARSKCTPTVIAHHFGSKYGLYAECIEAVLKKFEAMRLSIASVDDDPLAKLEKYFLVNLRLAQEFPEGVKLIVFLYSTASHDPKFADIYTRLVQRVRLRYLEIILSGVRERLFTTAVLPEDAAELVHEAIIGAIVNYLCVERRDEEDARIFRKWSAFIRQILGANPRILISTLGTHGRKDAQE
jgi:AcrR family transcriptional regulator